MVPKMTRFWYPFETFWVTFGLPQNDVKTRTPKVSKMVPKGTRRTPNGPQHGIKKMTHENPLCYFVEEVGGMSEATKLPEA